MIKWIKGFIDGIFYSNYHKERGEKKNDLWNYLYCNRNHTYY